MDSADDVYKDSTRILIYAVSALTVAILSFVILIMVTGYSMKYTNITVEAIQLFSAVFSLIIIADCIRRRTDLLFYKIIAQSLVCFILGQSYWVLHIYIKGYEQDGVFSISDLSWIGFYVILLSAGHTFFGSMLNFKKKKYKKINIVSGVAPLFIIIVNIALYLSGDSLLYTVIYSIPTALLSYYTLRFILISDYESSIIRGFRGYHIVVGLILVVDNLVCLAINYGFEETEYILKFCFAVLILSLAPAIYKGGLKWHR